MTTPQTLQPETESAAAAQPVPLVPAMPMPSGQLVQAVGRRKTAIVRVRLLSGTGVFTLNGAS